MAANRSALPASVQFSQLAKDLHRMGGTQRRKLRGEFARIGQSALSDARSRAGAWSRRIPSAISTRGVTDANQARVGVELRVSKSVPHARPYEGISQQGSTAYFRHPVFGHTDRWVSQKTRPYAWPAAKGREKDMRTAVLKTFEDTARDCGFR
jgi:hypothetical protein